MKALYRILTSLWSYQVFTALCVAACVAGSLVLPTNMSFFSGIDDTPLFRWLADNHDFSLTWWIYGLIAAISLLSLSTIVCTLDAIVKAAWRRDFLRKLYPQVMHVGVLLVLLGYLLSAAWGLREDLNISRGQSVKLANGYTLEVAEVKSETDEAGYYTAWEAELRLTGPAGEVRRVLRPLSPVYEGGLGLFFRTVSLEDTPSATIRVVRDPGAPWGLLGGVLVVLGGMGFVLTRKGT